VARVRLAPRSPKVEDVRYSSFEGIRGDL